MSLGEWFEGRYGIRISDQEILASTMSCTRSIMVTSDDKIIKEPSQNDNSLREANGEGKHSAKKFTVVKPMLPDAGTDRMKIVAVVVDEYSVTETTRPVNLKMFVVEGDKRMSLSEDKYIVNDKAYTDVLLPSVQFNSDRVWFKIPDIQTSVFRSMFPNFNEEHLTAGIMKITLKGNDTSVLPIDFDTNSTLENPLPVCPMGHALKKLSLHPQNPFPLIEHAIDEAKYEGRTVHAYYLPTETVTGLQRKIKAMMTDQRPSILPSQLKLEMEMTAPCCVLVKYTVFYCQHKQKQAPRV